MARKRKISESEFLDYANASSDSEYSSESHCKRPVARNAANARERARMRVLSKAFTRLKTSLPWVPADTKLSKLDTLRLASSYISHLRQILAEDASFPSNAIHPLNLTWPFTLHNRPSVHPNDDPPHSSSSLSCIHQFNCQYDNDNGFNMPYKLQSETIYQNYNNISVESFEYP